MIMEEVDPNKLIPHESTKKAYMAIIPNYRKPLYDCILKIAKVYSVDVSLKEWRTFILSFVIAKTCGPMWAVE